MGEEMAVQVEYQGSMGDLRRELIQKGGLGKCRVVQFERVRLSDDAVDSFESQIDRGRLGWMEGGRIEEEDGAGMVQVRGWAAGSVSPFDTTVPRTVTSRAVGSTLAGRWKSQPQSSSRDAEEPQGLSSYS